MPDWIQLTYWGSGSFEHATGRGSIGNPAESANAGLLAVGAAPFYDINTIEPFSSQGPTPDGRTKPEIVGIDCAASVTYEQFNFRGNTCWFPGTSQASPHVAGMAALVRQRFPDFTAEETAAYLKDKAEPRGAVPNNTWGYGLSKLPATDVGNCVHGLTGDVTTTGQWSLQCQSLALDRGFAQYYSFTLEEDAQVTIELNSGVDPYLFLRAGDARSGDFLYENDDIEAGANTNSRITAALMAGTYTIEATTYDTGETGDFTLTISGLGGGDGGTGTTPDGCGQTIIVDGPVSGTWDAGCGSGTPAPGTGSGARLARYYSFTLDRQSHVTIDLESSVDTYLYLREGTARIGDPEALNDDVEPGVNTNSQLRSTLNAGTYTIEATTYAANQTGNFTLTISGLSGTATDPDPEPEAEPCAATPITDGENSGEWISACQSQQRTGRYARYYTFTLDHERQITIDLESQVDTYLNLWQGEAGSGDPRLFNDDLTPGTNLNSRISASLSSGIWTIEATTYAEGQAGDFTLTISGLSGTATDPDPEPGAEPCAATPITDREIFGEWISACQSQERSGHYARYYSFTLAQESAVTITLESDVDPFLFLWEGQARSGMPLHFNDDIESGGVNLNSRISATLVADTYTIEATTYYQNESGTFILNISGLEGGNNG